jgi:hypothetical protein
MRSIRELTSGALQIKPPRSKLRGIKNELYYFNEASFRELNPKRLKNGQ